MMKTNDVIILNDMGGDVMNTSTDVTSTLRAQDHGHPPVVCFEPGIARREGSDSRFINDICSTLRAEMGDNQPAVCYAIEGNVVDRVSAKNGKGWCEDVSPILNTQDRHAVCFQLCGDRDNPSVSVSDKAFCIPANPMSDRGQAVCYIMDAMSSNSMKSANPNSGFHATEVSKCLDTRCLEPSCNQGGVMVCYRKTTHPHNPHEVQGYEETTVADTLNAFDSGEKRTPIIVLEGHGSRPSHMGNGYSESDTMYTLNTIEQHSVCYPKCYQETVGALCADDWRMINKQYVDQNKVICYENVQR